ncbi:MAG: hypothetical protein AB7U24_05880 [Sulfurimonadaceae bacterium]
MFLKILSSLIGVNLILFIEHMVLGNGGFSFVVGLKVFGIMFGMIILYLVTNYIYVYFRRRFNPVKTKTGEEQKS